LEELLKQYKKQQEEMDRWKVCAVHLALPFAVSDLWDTLTGFGGVEKE